MTGKPQTIEHRADLQRFCLFVDGLESVLEYRLVGKHINFNHTNVPAALRGRGIAERLVTEGLDWAGQQDYHIAASCWYVKKFL
jgi:hypothetical protein